MSSKSGSHRRMWAVIGGGFATAGVTTAILLAAPASADESGPAVAARTDHPEICQRLDRLAKRSPNLVIRFEAGPDTRGSISWLEAKAQAATTAGDNDLAQLYGERAARRTEALEVLKALGPELTSLVQRHCG
jgi:hypothetical protein